MGEANMAKAKQLIISVADRPGTIAAAVKTLAAARINILSVLGWNPSGVVQLITGNPRVAKKALDAAQVSCTEGSAELVELPNKPGALLEFLDKLAKKNINLRSLCATTSKAARKTMVVWAAED
jgi:hypothetical protein